MENKQGGDWLKFIGVIALVGGIVFNAGMQNAKIDANHEEIRNEARRSDDEDSGLRNDMNKEFEHVWERLKKLEEEHE